MLTYDVWKDGKKSAFTLSYDDARVEDRRLVAVMNKYGVKGTFNINSGVLGREYHIKKEEVKELYSGHEVAVHTYTHLRPDKCNGVTYAKEILEDRKNLEEIVGYTVTGMAYPFGTYNDSIKEITKSLGIQYSRVVKAGSFKTPEDFMEWVPTCHHNGAFDWLKIFKDRVGKRWCEGELFYVWGHSYELNTEEKWKMMEDFLAEISSIDNVWFATNIEIYNYLIAQRGLVVSVDETRVTNPSATDVWIRKDDVIYKIPGGETVILK